MTDSYQAIYDAVRSKISGGDVGEAVQSAIRNANLSHYADIASRAAQEIASEAMRPSVLFRPALRDFEGFWSAEYGDCEGTGDSPFAAMQSFDVAWANRSVKG